MTKREFFNTVIEMAQASNNMAMVEHATKEIAMLDAKGVRSSNKKSETNAPLMTELKNALLSLGRPACAREICDMVGISTQKGTPLLRRMSGVVNTVEKGKSYYSLTETEVEE